MDLRQEQIDDPVTGQYTPEQWEIVGQLVQRAFAALPHEAREAVLIGGDEDDAERDAA